MDYRTMVTTWSVIYSNSYRGAEDLLHGIGPISAFLMFVYVVEVAICGAIGSLYETRDIPTLKATGTMPLFYPTQDPAITFNQAKAPIDLASRAFLNFAKAYDPLALGGILSGDGTCNNGMVSAGHAASCNSVILSPLAPISLILGPQPPALPWTTLAPGDAVVTRSTRLDTMIECGPSDAIKRNTLLSPPLVSPIIHGQNAAGSDRDVWRWGRLRRSCRRRQWRAGVCHPSF
ncbi:hypothetical protein BDZ88DRAFT_426193 [Geranomyces variabilis]|nr:hypothetical protein BDZ88DRAFT_426193 [Geranomyces variabilis]